MVKLSCFVFDLDDTLYLERDYVKSGFQAVASAIGNKVGSAEFWFSYLWTAFEAGVRGDTFNRLLQEYPQVGVEYRVEDFIEIYRHHSPRISFIPGVEPTLRFLRESGFKLALITDGPLVTQRAKVQALRLERFFDHLVLTDQWGRSYWKPHPRPYEDVMNSLGLEPQHTVYIGDNPNKDFVGAKKLGWKTVRIRMADQLHYDVEPITSEYAPEVEVYSWAEMHEWVQDCAELAK